MPQIVLPPVLDVTVAAALKQELLTAFVSGDAVIDGGKVERVGALGLQVLVAAVLAGAKLVDSSQMLRDTAGLLGLTAALKLEESHV